MSQSISAATEELSTLAQALLRQVEQFKLSEEHQRVLPAAEAEAAVVKHLAAPASAMVTAIRPKKLGNADAA